MTKVSRRAVRTRAACTLALTGSLILVGLSSVGAAEAPPAVAFDQQDGQLKITIDGRPFAIYYHEDGAITRPFFANVRAPNGVQATRRHPPAPGKDLSDHATFHPGIWMSFGDVSGSDYWRLLAPVELVKLIEQPQSKEGRGSFAVLYSYQDQRCPDQEVCREHFRCEVCVTPAGYLLLWDSTFSSDKEFYFGDQEEMGLGVRVATPLRVQETSREFGVPPGNGAMIDSAGRKNEAEIGGHVADWCDYSGVINEQKVGVAIFCHPENFRPSWYHARDYGFLAANPFGRAAFGKGEPSKVVVKPGEELRLRYGVLVHSSPIGAGPDLNAAYADYLQAADN